MVFAARAPACDGSTSRDTGPTQAALLARRGDLRGRSIRFQASLRAPDTCTNPKTRLGLRLGRTAERMGLRLSSVPEGHHRTPANVYNAKRSARRQGLFQLRPGDEICAVNSADTYDDMLNELVDAQEVRLSLERKLEDVLEAPTASIHTAAFVAATAVTAISTTAQSVGSSRPASRLRRRCAMVGSSNALDEFVSEEAEETEEDSTASIAWQRAERQPRRRAVMEHRASCDAEEVRRSSSKESEDETSFLLRVKEMLHSQSSTREPSPSVCSDSSHSSGFLG